MPDKKIIDLSVIIPTYNRHNTLFNTLRLLLDQDPQPLEIIVIDQTKKHDSVQSLREELSKEAPNLRFIDQIEVNANVARNRGIREAKGRILLFLDDDIIIPPGFLREHFTNYRDLSIAAVSGQVLEEGEEPTDKFPKYYYHRHTGWMYFPLNFSRRSEVINLNSCNLSILKDIIVEAGGFDENYVKTFFDDTDLSVRVHRLCLKKKLKTIHDPAPSLVHLKAKGGKRPGGINQYVIADRNTWMIWFYFFINNFALYSWREILIRLRTNVFRRINFLKPKYLVIAFIEFILGLFLALKAKKRGRRLGFSKKI